MYRHRWRLSDKRTNSGKALFHCPVCGLYDPAPVKEKYEERECIPNKYNEQTKD